MMVMVIMITMLIIIIIFFSYDDGQRIIMVFIQTEDEGLALKVGGLNMFNVIPFVCL